MVTVAHTSSPLKARIIRNFSAGHWLMATGAIHQDEGPARIVRLEGRFGTVPVLQVDGFRAVHRLYEPRLVDIVGDNLVLLGMEHLKDGAWVAQQWWFEPRGYVVNSPDASREDLYGTGVE